ncbi:MAG: hypothetical protein HY881_11460 [Deltaproteobacteria bacterium]|nr:hypothetical protein [Deltaproteobacteria bacterium]
MKDIFSKRILFILLLVLLSPCLASATTYYVDNRGTNNSSCGTTSGAGGCATLSYLVGTRHLGSTGDNILIAAGAYTDNTQTVLPVGVHIQGAGSATTSITTNVTNYIRAQSSVPTVDGSNEISGFNLIASSSNHTGILSTGRNNQKIHDMVFTNWGENIGGIWISGKYGYNDTSGGYWANCVGGEASCTFCDNNKSMTVYPLSTDWATGVEVYNNTFINSKMSLMVIKGGKIYNNTINNDSGTDISGIGHTGYFYSGIEIFNNTINMNSISNTVIAMELWCIGEGSKIHNNIISGWTSFVHHGLGKGSNTYSLEIYENAFYISKAMAGTNPNIEISNAFSDAAIYNNYFASSATDRGCGRSIAIWGPSVKNNISVYGNIFGLQYSSTTSEVIAINDFDSTSSFNNLYVYNNVFDCGASRVAGLLYQDSTGVVTNSYWRNNIVNNMKADFILSALSSWTGHTADHNYSYNCTTNYSNPRNAKWATANNVITSTTAPGFVGSGAKPSPYYLLQSTSPCIGAGVALGTQYNTDPTGNSRTLVGKAIWDIGAYAYYPAFQPPSNLRVQ